MSNPDMSSPRATNDAIQSNPARVRLDMQRSYRGGRRNTNAAC